MFFFAMQYLWLAKIYAVFHIPKENDLKRFYLYDWTFKFA